MPCTIVEVEKGGEEEEVEDVCILHGGKGGGGLWLMDESRC